jgi:hypothetical protein
MGGAVPFGYRVESRALHIVEEHAEFVRDIFRRYLEVGSVVRLKIVAISTGSSRTPFISDDFATRAKSTTACMPRSSTNRLGTASNSSLWNKRNQGRIPAGMPSPFLQANFTMIAAIGWARAIPRRVDGAGGTISREQSSRVATQTPDQLRGSRQRKSRSRCSMRSKASSRPDARSMDWVRCLTWMFPGEQPARSPRGLSSKSSPFTTRCSTR